MIPLHYDFHDYDQPIDRTGTNCDKWDGMMAREGRPMLPMWVADMDFRCPPEVVQALADRAAHPVYGYTEQSDQQVEAMLAFLARRHGITLTAEQQITMPCVVTGLKAAVRTLAQPGEGVLIQPPVYGPFEESIRCNDRRVVESPLLRDEAGYYTMDYAGVEAAFQSGVKVMLLCNPHNPVGRLWSRAELDRLYALVQQYDVTLISDEIHMDFVFERGAFVSALHLDNSESAKIVVLTSASKTFNLAGLKQATLLSRNPSLRRKLLKDMHQAGVVSGNIFSYVATEAAFLHGDAWLDGLLAYLAVGEKLVRRELAERLPKAIMSPLEATYLAWVDLRAYGMDTDTLMKRCSAHGVAFTPGVFFGKQAGEGFLRINFACPHSQTLEALKRLEAAVKEDPAQG